LADFKLGDNLEIEMKYFFGICAVTALTAFSCLAAGSGGAGSSGQPVVKTESPAVAAYNQGVALMKAKQFARAQEKFEQAVRQDSGFAEAHNNLAFCLRKQGSQNFQKSLEHYDRAIALKPKLAAAYEYRGILYVQMGRKADAENDLATLKKLSPHLAGELEAYIKTGKEEEDQY
jgi:tetratricopeptide (TPR) repeat protein